MTVAIDNLPLGRTEIGGGIVRRRFTCGGKAMLAGQPLTVAQINAMSPPNRRALISNGRIAVYPVAPGQPSAAASMERHIVGGPGGRYSVIEGRKLNDTPLTKEEAEELATRPS